MPKRARVVSGIIEIRSVARICQRLEHEPLLSDRDVPTRPSQRDQREAHLKGPRVHHLLDVDFHFRVLHLGEELKSK